MDRAYRLKCVSDSLVDLVNAMREGRRVDEDIYSLLIPGSVLAFMKMNMLESVLSGHTPDFSRIPDDARALFDGAELDDMVSYVYTGISYDEDINSVLESKRTVGIADREALVREIKMNPAHFFEELVEYSVNSKKIPHVPVTRELSLLLYEILKKENVTEVYNPFSGLGSLGLYPDLKYAGQEFDRQSVLVSKIRYYLSGNRNAVVNNRNSVEFWDHSFAKHQSIVSVLPVGYKMPEMQ